MKEYKVKNQKLRLHYIILSCMLISTFFMALGYSQLSGIDLSVNTTSNAIAQDGIYICNVEGVNVSDSTVKSYIQNMMNVDVDLSKSSTAVYKVTFYNNSSVPFTYSDTVFDEAININQDITYELSGISEGTEVEEKKYLTFQVTFKHKDGIEASNSNNYLDAYIGFKFILPNVYMTLDKEKYQVNSNSQITVRTTIINNNNFDISANLTTTSENFQTFNRNVEVLANSTLTVSISITMFKNDSGNLILNVLEPINASYELPIKTEISQKDYGYIVSGSNTDSTSTYLGTKLLKNQIEEINFVDMLDVPENPLGYFDVSYNGTLGEIMAYYYNENENYNSEGNELYELYIGTDATVVKIKKGDYLFANLINLEKINFIDANGINRFDTSDAKTMSYMFYKCTNLKKLDLTSFKTIQMTHLNNMFASCTNLKEIDLSSFVTKNVINMAHMFNKCSSISNLNVSNFDTSNVTVMLGMFEGTTSLEKLDLSNFNTSKVFRMGDMFRNCGVTELDLSNFDTSNTTEMSSMFQSCSKLEKVDISSFDTSKVKSFHYMFSGTSIQELDLTNFSTNTVTDTHNMFDSCKKLKTVYVNENWDLSNVTNSTKMFAANINIVGGNGTVFNSNYIDKTYARIDGYNDLPGYFSQKVTEEPESEELIVEEIENDDITVEEETESEEVIIEETESDDIIKEKECENIIAEKEKNNNIISKESI